MIIERMGFPETDWKLFRSRVPGWQEAYMDRLNKEYIELLSGEGNASEKFWALEERINKDKKNKGVILRKSRSQMLSNILSLIEEGAIGYEDLDGFSDELRESVQGWLKFNE